MARALIVGCGCRGRALGLRLAGAGWLVRGTSRRDQGLEEISTAGLEAVRADPADAGSVLAVAGDVTVLVWLLGSARVEPGGGGVEAAHGEALEGLLERLVDSPVRGLVYEAGGSVPAALRDRGAGVARAAESRWQLPVAICEVAPDDPAGQVAALEAEVLGLL